MNIRWPSELNPKEYDHSATKMLYKDTLELLNHEGYGAIRKGGSNWKTTFSNGNILSLLNSNTVFHNQ